MDPAAPARRAAFRHARRKGTTRSNQNRNYPQPVKHPKPTALGRRPGDVAGAYTRIDRAERLLGWRPQYDITEGIRHSLQWAALRDQVLSGEPAPRISPPDR